MYLGRTVAASLLILLALAPAQGQDASPPKVSVAAAVIQQVTDQMTFIGKGEALDKIDLIARVPGFLRSIDTESGAEVEAGDILFHIEPDQFEATLAARQADLARADANLTLSGIELERTRTLVTRSTVAQSELDSAEANSAIAKADVAAAEAAVDAAQLDLDYTRIAAPFDGRLGRIARSVGDLVDQSTGPLATLVRQSPIYVTFSLSERQFADIRQKAIDAGTLPGNGVQDIKVRATLPNGTEIDETGRIAFAGNQIDPATGTIPIRAEFANTDTLILDGAFLNVRVEASAPIDKLTIPQAAVQRDQRGEFVLAVNDQQMVEQRYITVGEQVATSIVVTEGLREGETVIVEGLQRVRPGVPVEAVLAGAGN